MHGDDNSVMIVWGEMCDVLIVETKLFDFIYHRDPLYPDKPVIKKKWVYWEKIEDS